MREEPVYRTIREQIAERIRSDVLSRRFEEGVSLREAALAQRFGVSRAPVRDALLQLTQEGLLVAKPNCGVRVGPKPDEAIQPLETIQRQAHELLSAQHRDRAEPPQIRVNELDPRLRLPNCQAKLEAFLPGGAKPVGNTSVGVRCPNPRWTVYQRASVRIFDRVLMANHHLAKGTVLSAADLRAERHELSVLPGGYETAPERLIGKQLRRALPAGAVIPPQAVKAAPLIKQGETVTLVIRQGGMEVSSSGIALSEFGNFDILVVDPDHATAPRLPGSAPSVARHSSGVAGRKIVEPTAAANLASFSWSSPRRRTRTGLSSTR